MDDVATSMWGNSCWSSSVVSYPWVSLIGAHDLTVFFFMSVERMQLVHPFVQLLAWMHICLGLQTQPRTPAGRRSRKLPTHVGRWQDTEGRIELHQSRLFCGKIYRQLHPLWKPIFMEDGRMKWENGLTDHEENIHNTNEETIPSKGLTMIDKPEANEQTLITKS